MHQGVEEMMIKNMIKDKKGAALIYVIVAAAIIIMLGAATTATAFVNLKSMQISEQSNTNFYNADAVMNMISSGLESDVSKAYEKSYQYVVEKWNTNEQLDKEEVQKIFDDQFVLNLDELIQDTKSYTWYYSLERLQEYVDAVNVSQNDIRYTISAVQGNNFIDRTLTVFEDGKIKKTGVLILRNLHVTYEDDNGYFDEITTDIKITIPEIDLTNPSQNPHDLDAFVFSHGLYVGQNEEDFKSNYPFLQVNGNTYINTNSGVGTVLEVDDYGNVEFIIPEEIIISGDIETQTGSNLSITPKNTSNASLPDVWFDNIEVGRQSTILLNARSHVYDDLTVQGSKASVTLTGEYYGFGNEWAKSYNETTANRSLVSSALIINGTKTTLDIRNLDRLVLAGSSYISTNKNNSGTSFDSFDKASIRQGEAISIKSNQIAYLVDEKEFNGSNINAIYMPSNPMSYNEYKDFVNNNYEDFIQGSATDFKSREAAVLDKITNERLSYKTPGSNLNATYSTFKATVKPVYSATERAVYLFLNFKDKDSAASYFQTVYSGNTLLSQRLRYYAAQYVSSLQISDSTSIKATDRYINPDIALYTENVLTADQEWFDNTDKKYYVNGTEITTLNNTAQSLYEIYMGSDGNEGLRDEYKYSKYVNSAQLTEFVQKGKSNTAKTDDATNNKLEYLSDVNGIKLTGTSASVTAYIIDNGGGKGDIFKTPEEGGRGIIVASGDVEICGNWTGTIIANGTVYCYDGNYSVNAPKVITVDKNYINAALPLYFSAMHESKDTLYCVNNIFLGHENDPINRATDNNKNYVDGDIIANCITYTNWNKH